jgi:DNA-binding MarR family transcriptional regulator
MRSRNDKAGLAADAWRHLFEFIVATADQRNRVLQELGLTPNDSRALTSLDAERGRTMRSLAEEWRCDASTATWIVDRLERRGLVTRDRPADNRRVVRLGITPAGIALLDDLREPLRDCHARQLGHLPRKDLEALVALLRAARLPHEDLDSLWQ